MTLGSLRSPFGGNILQSLGFIKRRPQNVVYSQETGVPVILDDIYSYEIGYATQDIKKGERIAYKDSEARKLWKMLEKELK